MKIQQNISIAKRSTFKVGGKASFFCEVKNFKDLVGAVEAANRLNTPFKLMAGGSNIVFPDGVLNEFLIKVKSFSRPFIKIEGSKIEVDSGAELMKLIKTAIRNGLKGLETLSGIPGTVGGAIVGNAGAYGHSISEVVDKIEVFGPVRNSPPKGSSGPRLRAGAVSNGMGWKRYWLSNKDCRFHYRHSVFKEQPWIVLRAVLKFKKENPKELKKTSQNIIIARIKKYKSGLRCPGSFFKNVLVSETSQKSLRLIDKEKIIEGKIPAGYLLEQVGAKGMHLGGIRIADFHGNLLINSGTATAKDVKKMAEILKMRVQKKFGINLEEEIRYF